VSGDEAVFLDDIGENLKAAAQFGIKTIKVSKGVFHQVVSIGYNFTVLSKI